MLAFAAIAAVIVAFASSGVRAQAPAPKLDITGAWVFTVDTGTIGTPTVTFKQDGEKLTGHYSSETLGEADLTGTLQGAELNFTFNANIQGMDIPVAYKGTVESNASMKGTIDVAGGMATGTFTAKRKE
jgi:hypothetical protein